MAKIKKKRKKSHIYNYFIIVGIFIYMIFNMMANIYKHTIKTEDIVYGDISDFITKKGAIIRDEKVIYSPIDGNISYFVKEKQRISKGTKIAQIQSKELDSSLQEQLNITDRKIQSIKDNKNTSLLQSDIDKIDNNIYMLELEIKNKLIHNDLENIDKLKEDLLYNIDKRNIIMGNKGISSKSLQGLKDEKKQLETKINNAISIVNADSTGMISFNSDAKEKTLNTSSLNHLNADYILNLDDGKNLIQKSESVKQNQPIAKLVNNHYWYVACVLEKDEVPYFKENKKVKIIQANKEFVGQTMFLYKDKDGKDIVVFKINKENDDILDKRTSDFKIVYKQETGIKVPKSAIIKQGNKKGVFVVSETGHAKFKPLESIVGEDEEYVVLNYAYIKKNRIDTVNLYDEVIINPKGVKDGQKVR